MVHPKRKEVRSIYKSFLADGTMVLKKVLWR